MTAYRRIVIEHFRRPRNREPFPDANRSAEGANPLCGDRIRMQLLVCDDVVMEARFTADACALCIASASLLTEHVRGQTVNAARAIDMHWIASSLEGEPPPGRAKCATLPLDTLRRALDA
ncbi:MAG TPA: iron-sulfur cluster assembly scaffold protein [Gemmatimonadaceae bacterium]